MNFGRKVLVALLRLYKLLVSPALHVIAGPMGGCRFHPTCSVYAAEAVALHGVLKGTWLTVRRLCRCHPWGGCGEDPVPPSFKTSGQPLKPAISSHSCCTHVTMQHAAHFGCPPPAR